jgi:hypothetical protein
MLYFNEVQQRQAAYAAAVADTNKLLAIRKELIKYVADRGGRYLKLKSKKRGEEDTPNQWTIIKDKPVHTQLKEDLHVKVYITDDITELDFIVGRGGHGQSHPGNQAYLDHKDTLRQRYLDAKKNKDLKHEISKELVHWLQRRGGRFLKQDRVGWYIMSNEILYEQAKQKLNEPRKGRTEI